MSRLVEGENFRLQPNEQFRRGINILSYNISKNIKALNGSNEWIGPKYVPKTSPEPKL